MTQDHDLQRLIQHASTQYEQLVLIVGRHGSGKTQLLQSLAETLHAPILNVSLELSQHLLELPPKVRPTRLQICFEDLIASADEKTVLLDNLELLFEPSLRADPLSLLRKASRKRTLVATWGGRCEDHHLIYAAPGHPEYRREDATGLIMVQTEASHD